MEQQELTRLSAYIGLAMIVAAIVIGVWVAAENRVLGDEDNDDREDGEKRIAFFYSWNSGSGFFLEFDSTYYFNPVPGFSGFGFFTLMGGITFVLFAFYSKTSTGEDDIGEKIALAAVTVMIVSIILAAWVGIVQYDITKERYDPDDEGIQGFGSEEISEKYKSIAVLLYMNSVLVFFGPTLMLFSIYRDRAQDTESFNKYLPMIGLVVLGLALVLALISGLYSLKMTKEVLEDDADADDIFEWMKNKAFIGFFSPYLAYLGMGLVLFPLAYNHARNTFTNNRASHIVLAGIIILVVGVLIAIYPAIQYSELCTAWSDSESDDKIGDEADEFFNSLPYCKYATTFMLLGMGLLTFPVVFGHYLDNGDMISAQKLNMLFLALLIAGVIMGLTSGILMTEMMDDLTNDDEMSNTTLQNHDTMEYLYMVLMFSSFGLMMYNWTLNEDLFTSYRNLCPDCGEEVEFDSYHQAWYCEECEDYPDEPYRQEIKRCPDCSCELDYIDQYDRWYCYECSAYMTPGVRKKKAKKRKAPARERRPAAGTRQGSPVSRTGEGQNCRYCRRPMTYIPQYKRWYCYGCNRYG